METHEIAVTTTAALAFAVVAVYCVSELWAQHSVGVSFADPTTTSSSGFTFRVWYFRFLAIACTGRAAMILMAQFVLADGHALLTEFMATIFHGAPSLLFATAFSLLIVFWAHLTHAPDSTRFLWPLWVTGNVCVYITWCIAAMVCRHVSDAADFEQVSLGIVGVVNALLSVLFIAYGVRIRALLKSVGTSADAARMVRATLAISFICAASFATAAAYTLAVCANNSRTFHPTAFNAGEFDCTYYLLLELVPAIAVLFLTSRRKTESMESASMNNVALGSESYDRLM